MRRSASADEVEHALGVLSATEETVDRETLQTLGIGANDAKVLRHLIEHEPTGALVTPRALTDLLGVSSAAMTALIDRLSDAGLVERARHPQDRRSIVVRATLAPGSPARRLLAVKRVAVALAASRLGSSERRTVVDFLAELARAHEHYLHGARDDAASS